MRKKIWGKMIEPTEKWGKIEEMLVSSPPGWLGSERLATTLQCWQQKSSLACSYPSMYRPFSHCIDQAGLGAFTAKSGRKHYNPPPLTVMWMNFDSPNFPSFCSLSAIILFQTCCNKCILYVFSFHKCIKIKYKMVNMYGVYSWFVQSSSCWNTIHSHRNCGV